MQKQPAVPTYALHYRATDKFFVREFTGLVTTEIIIQGMQTLRDHPEYHEKVPVLWDLRETDPAQILTSDMFKFSGEVSDRVQQAKRDTHIAFLVSTDLQFAVAQQFVTVAGWIDQEVRVTKSWQEAHDWLTVELKSS